MSSPCLDPVHSPPLKRKPTIRTRRNPSKQSLLHNSMLSSTDPGLSPSCRTYVSPKSYRSSRCSSSDFEYVTPRGSIRRGGKINQLMKVNEAIALELADIESGKEKWFEKLKLLEAKVCSNLVNIDKWAVENKSKFVTLGEEVSGDVQEGSLSPMQWRLPLADLVSIFRANKIEGSSRLPLENLSTEISKAGVHENLVGSPNSLNSIKGISRDLNHSPEGTVESAAADKNLSGSPVRAAGSLIGESMVPPNRASSRDQGAGNAESFQIVGTSYAPNKGTSSFSRGDSPAHGLSALKEGKQRRSDNISSSISSQINPQVGQNAPLTDPGSNQDIMVRQDKIEIDKVIEQVKDLEKEKATTTVILEDAKKRIIVLEDEKNKLNNRLKEYLLLNEKANMDVLASNKRNQELEKMLSEYKQTFDLKTKNIQMEKDALQDEVIRTKRVLDDFQKNAIELQEKKSQLESEMYHFKSILQETDLNVKCLTNEKKTLEYDYDCCKKTLDEARQQSELLEKTNVDLTLQLKDYRHNLEKKHKEKENLQRELSESKQALEEALKKSMIIMKEKTDLSEIYKTLISDFEKSEQQVMVMENENAILERERDEIKQALEEAQEQILVLEREKYDLESEVSESKEACKEAWNRVLQLEEEKGALEISSYEYKQVLDETEQHVLTLQSALEGTLQRADALDHQVERLRNENKKQTDIIQELQLKKSEQDATHRDLEVQMQALRAEFENIKIKEEENENRLKNINASHSMVTEELSATRRIIQEYKERELDMVQESKNLKSSLEDSTNKYKVLETDHKEQQLKLKDLEQRLQRELEDCQALKSQHEIVVKDLQSKCLKNERQLQDMMKKMDEKELQLQRANQEYNQLCAKWKNLEKQFENVNSDLVYLKSEVDRRTAALQKQRAEKEGIIQDLESKAKKIKELDKELKNVKIDNTSKAQAIEDGNKKNTNLMTQLHSEQTRSRELEAALEFTKIEHSNMLLELEEERMTKESAVHQCEDLRRHNEKLQRELNELKADASITLHEDNLEKEAILQALQEVQARNRELEEVIERENAEQESSQLAWEGEREVNEALAKELEKEQVMRRQLNEELNLLKTEAKRNKETLIQERATKETVKKQLYDLQHQCKVLQGDFNDLRIEHESMKVQEELTRVALIQELEEARNMCVELQTKQMAKVAETNSKSYPTREVMLNEMQQLLAQSKKLEEMIMNSGHGPTVSGLNEIPDAIKNDVRHLQYCIKDIQELITHGGYLSEGEEEQLLPLLEECEPISGPQISSEESANSSNNPNTSVQEEVQNVNSTAQKTEEEIRRLKETTEILHQTFIDAHHTAISGAANLLGELEALKQLLHNNTITGGDRKEDRNKSVSISAALSTSALAALGLLAYLKFPKHVKMT